MDSCRHGKPEDCANQDGSWEPADICPYDGERCITGLCPGTYDKTLFPTRIPPLWDKEETEERDARLKEPEDFE